MIIHLIASVVKTTCMPCWGFLSYALGLPRFAHCQECLLEVIAILIFFLFCWKSLIFHCENNYDFFRKSCFLSFWFLSQWHECLPMLGGCEENALIFDQMIVTGAFMLKKWIKSDCLNLRFWWLWINSDCFDFSSDNCGSSLIAWIWDSPLGGRLLNHWNPPWQAQSWWNRWVKRVIIITEGKTVLRNQVSIVKSPWQAQSWGNRWVHSG